METRFLKPAVKALRQMDEKTRSRMLAAIEGLTLTPPVGDIKPLIGVSGKFRLRVGKYRVIYSYGEDGGIIILYVEDIGSRGDIYK